LLSERPYGLKRSVRKARISSLAFKRGMSVLVDEVGGDNAVGGPDHFAEERGRVGVRRTARKDTAVEGVAEECLVGGEALAGAPAVVVEAVGENLQSIARDAVSDRARALVADLRGVRRTPIY